PMPYGATQRPGCDSIHAVPLPFGTAETATVPALQSCRATTRRISTSTVSFRPGLVTTNSSQRPMASRRALVILGINAVSPKECARGIPDHRSKSKVVDIGVSICYRTEIFTTDPYGFQPFIVVA